MNRPASAAAFVCATDNAQWTLKGSHATADICRRKHIVVSAQSIVLLTLSFCVAGCHNRPTSRVIPNHVSSDEIAIYQAWLQDSFARSNFPHRMWYIETGTSPYGEDSSCDEKLTKDGVKPEYVQALRDLGTASYLIPPFSTGFARTFDPYRSTIDGKTPDGSFVRYFFSRVVFSSDGREAFLHVSGIKGPGVAQGGFGEELLATEHGTVWHFHRVGCPEILD